MARDLYEITWGSIRLFCAKVETDNSRTLVVHELAQGDEHPVSDRGAAPRTTRCDLLFDDFPGEPGTPLDRFLKFKAMVDDGVEDVFIHPIDGAYSAKVGDFHYSIDDDTNFVEVTCEFRANDVIAATLRSGLGVVPSIGVDAVAARADELNAALESVDLSPELLDVDLPADLITAAAALPDAWIEGELPTRDILVDVARVTDQLATLTSLLEDDLALFPAWKAAMLFGAAFRVAAQAATSETASVFVMRVGTPTSVLALVVRVYGGTEADERERQVRSLNDIRTPSGLLEAGTELVMPALTNRQRQAA